MLKSQNKIGKFQYWYVIIFVIAIHFVLIYRFFELQVLDHDMYTKQAENNLYNSSFSSNIKYDHRNPSGITKVIFKLIKCKLVFFIVV